MEFLNSLKLRLKHYSSPFDHWEYNRPLTKGAIEEICKTEIIDLNKMNINYDGTRAIDGGEGKFREGTPVWIEYCKYIYIYIYTY